MRNNSSNTKYILFELWHHTNVYSFCLMKCINIKGMEMTGKNQSTEYNVFKKNLGSVKKCTDIRVTYMTAFCMASPWTYYQKGKNMAQLLTRMANITQSSLNTWLPMNSAWWNNGSLEGWSLLYVEIVKRQESRTNVSHIYTMFTPFWCNKTFNMPFTRKGQIRHKLHWTNSSGTISASMKEKV